MRFQLPFDEKFLAIFITVAEDCSGIVNLAS